MQSKELPTAVNRSGGGRAVEGTAFCLEFVNVNVSSQAEKRRNQRVIRSTAMKNFRRRQLSQRTQAKETSRILNETVLVDLPRRTREPCVSDEGAGGFNKGQEIGIKKGAIPDTKQDVSAQVVGDWASQSFFNETRHESSRDGNQCEQRLSSYTSTDFRTMASPVSILGGGRVDPFRTYPAGYVGSHVHELIDHSTTFLWPGLRPQGSHGCENRISSAWLEKVTGTPLVMHAMLFGGAVHMDVLRSPRINLHNPVRLFHKVETLRLLKEGLKNQWETDPDELILAVLTLGANEVETMMHNMKPKTRSPFISPLSSSQWLDVYGSMAKVKAHTLAMQSLVDYRGGLEKIQLEGLAEVLEFADILGATQALSKPHWPLLERTVKAYTSRRSWPICNSLKSLGQGFQGLQVFVISDNAAFVLQALAELTVAIECYCRGASPAPDLPMVIDRRNFVQHALMSLPTADDLEFGIVSSGHLYNSIRYTALIYSIGVTFPLPPITGIYDKLTGLLKSVLEESECDICWKLYPKTLLWVLVLGGIAASITPHKYWYVQKLLAVSTALGFSKWEDVAKEMGRYLWLERACDAAGRKLWLDVSRERSLACDSSSEANGDDNL